jgi:hypothetical protein
MMALRRVAGLVRGGEFGTVLARGPILTGSKPHRPLENPREVALIRETGSNGQISQRLARLQLDAHEFDA